MNQPTQPPTAGPDSEGPTDRLDSWKDIAAYLKRDVSTVQRWEKREGMPVHRHLHDKLGSIYAFRSELDAWSRRRGMAVDAVPPAGSSVPPPRARRWPFIWLTLGTAAALTAAAAAWLLERSDYFWRNPLADAEFRVVTDFEGTEQAAAISRDGNFVAFVANRDGPVDVWVTQVGSGRFHNLTGGAFRELTNPSVRTISFSPDAASVYFWVRESGASNAASIDVWTVPTMGGPFRPSLKDVAEFDWSPDGRRLVYHTPGPGDPMFITDRNQSAKRAIFEAPAGLHAHFPVWSIDEQFIYFVQGALPDKMDIWRIAAAGGTPERMTSHHSQVSHPVFLNERTLMYLAAPAGGSRAALYALDIERRVPRRVSVGLDHYTSLAASADGRRLVATVARTKSTLWRVPISGASTDESAAAPITLPTAGGVSPRLGANFLLYVASRGGHEGIWKLASGTATELWSAANARIVGAPSIAPDGRRIAFVVEEDGRTRLSVMDDDGTNLRVVTASLDLRGAPAWTPDGQAISVAASHDGTPRLFRVSLDGTAVPLLAEHSIDPAWSPEGRFLAYSGPDVGTTFPVKAATVDGRPYPIRDLTLPRGARRLRFLPAGGGLIVLRGEIEHKDFWLIDLETGSERRLTNFARNAVIQDFDVSPDGREIVFDRVQENSDIVLIDRQR